MISSQTLQIRVLLLVIGCLLLVVASNAIPCDPWTGPILSLNTSNSFMEIKGDTVRFYGRNSTHVDRSTYIQYSTREIVELDNSMFSSCVDGHIYLLPPYVQPYVTVIRTFTWQDFDCEVYEVTETLQTSRTSPPTTPPAPVGSAPVGAPEMQTINITSVIYNITLRNETGINAPNFFMQLNFSVVTGPHQINLGSSPLSQGKDYIINYDPEKIKISLKVKDWPYAGINGSSYVGLFFDGLVNSTDDYSYNLHNSFEQEFVQIQTKKWRLRQDIDHMFMGDGIPIYKIFDNGYYIDAKWDSVGSNVSAFTGGVSTCLTGIGPLPHFNLTEYDPQFSALFLGPDDALETSSSTPEQKKSNNAVKIGVGVSMGILALLVIVVILAAVFIDGFRHFIRPYSKRAHNSFHEAPRPEITPDGTEDTGSSNWVRSSKSNKMN